MKVLRYLALGFTVLLSTFAPSDAFKAFDFTGMIPPDSCISVSDKTIFAGVNGAYGIWDKAGNRLAIASMPAFFQQSGGRYFDPRSYFDGNRFIVISALNSGTPSYIAVAISKNKNPRTLGASDWTVYHIDVSVGSTWCDYPMMGVTDTHIHVTCNMFTNSMSFSNFMLVTMDKNNPNSHTKRNLGGFFSAHPVSETEYIVGSVGHNYIILWDRGQPIQLSKPYYANWPVPVPQRGSNVQVSPGDSRIQNAVYVKGLIYASHHVNINNRNAVVVYVIDPEARKVVDTIEIKSDSEHYFFPCVIDQDTIVFNIGSPTERIGVGYYDGQRVVELEVSGATAPRARYGDYNSCAAYGNENWFIAELPSSREWKAVIHSSNDEPEPDPEPEGFRDCIEDCLEEFPENLAELGIHSDEIWILNEPGTVKEDFFDQLTVDQIEVY